jgi:tRNA-2-methylthio-N6-dimethylallyladenosine synthase
MGTKKIYLRTFGCQMNVYDSERMEEALAGAGYAATGQLEDADVIVLNTCHIRDKAAEKVYSELGRVRRAKALRRAAGRETIVAVAGCVAQAEGAEIARRAPVVDIVVGPQAYHRLPDLVARVAREGGLQLATELDDEDKFAALPARTPARGVTAFLTVQEGCDKFCTFCVVPYTRGVEVSRPVADVLAEARRLAASGVREITLLGQNVNAYHGSGPDGSPWSLARLIGALAKIEGIVRWRYTTSHPRDMQEDLIAAHRLEAKLMPYCHLPFQSGSDRVLAAMNRRHTARDYAALIEALRRSRPDIALSTDIIVGFPGESAADFEATLALVERVRFAQAYAFKYSPRPGTPAAALVNAVPDAIKAARLEQLQGLLAAQQTAFNAACVGRVLPVLFEQMGRHPGQVVGRTPYWQAAHVQGDAALCGQEVQVLIHAVAPNSLAGRVVGEAERRAVTADGPAW